MKKLLSIVLAILMVVSVLALVACKGNTTPKTLKFGMGVAVSAKASNATPANEEEEIAAKDGTIEFDTTIFAAAVDANGKVVAVDTDCTQVKFTFDAAGKTTFTAPESGVLTKRERGNGYGMSKIGKKEWFEQADAFETQCLGKTAAEIVALVGTDGKGVEAVQTAGCTITASGFAAAAAKIAPAK